MGTVRRATAGLALVATTALLGACGEATEPPVGKPAAFALTLVDPTPHGRPGVLDIGHPVDDLEQQVRRELDVRVTLDVHAPAPAATAPSYTLSGRTGDGVSRQADALASVLGLAGHEVTARTDDGRLTWEDGDRTLVVGPGPGAPWAYTRDGVRCTDTDVTEAANLASCAPYAEDGWSPGDRRSTPLTADAARHAAGPVLDAVGVDPDAAGVTTGWGTSLVSVDPTVAGLPTSGMATSVVVDAHGVLAANGWLGSVDRGPDYPVLGAAEVVALRRGGQPELRCPSSPPPGAFRPPECDRPEVVVDTAAFGLMRWTVDRRPVLVPAWIYAESAGPWQNAVPAVTREHIPPGALPPVPVRAAGAAGPAPAR